MRHNSKSGLTVLEVLISNVGSCRQGPLYFTHPSLRRQRIVSDRRNSKDQNDTGHLREGGRDSEIEKHQKRAVLCARCIFWGKRFVVKRGSKIRYIHINQWISQINEVHVFDVLYTKRMATGVVCKHYACKSYVSNFKTFRKKNIWQYWAILIVQKTGLMLNCVLGFRQQ